MAGAPRSSENNEKYRELFLLKRRVSTGEMLAKNRHQARNAPVGLEAARSCKPAAALAGRRHAQGMKRGAPA